MVVYTSITQNYLPKARVLAYSLKKFHPDWEFILLYADTLPKDFDLSNEPFDEILFIEELNINNLESWIFKHSIVELCTAIKGAAAEFLATKHNISKIIYLDPDIKIFNSLKDIELLLDTYDILLTPHILDMEEDKISIIDNEISALKHGIYNLGFFAAKTSEQGLKFIKWWSNRLKDFCFDDIPNGLFTDQKWCDLAPIFFDNLHIIRDKGYNVATWNIAQRPLSINKTGLILAGNSPLRFYHFTGYDSGAGKIMLNRYGINQSVAFKLWDEYEQDLNQNGQCSFTNKSWKYATFDNGEQITTNMRLSYRLRSELQNNFPNPFITGKNSFLNWWRETDSKHKRYQKILNDSNTKIVFFGASNLFKKALLELSRNHIYPSYVCDSDKNKQGNSIESYKIFSPDDILNNDEKYFIIITSSFIKEIKEQLKKYKSIVAVDDYSSIINLYK